jgi:hypothetical protein
MSFDPANFEAEVALRLIPTERLPAIAQDALEDGFDGPNVLRMAILEPVAGWGIDQALPPMLAELGRQAIPPKRPLYAWLRCVPGAFWKPAKTPCPPFRISTDSCWRRTTLIELGYFDDDDIFFSDIPEEKRTRAREALEELLSPELRQRRLIERKVAWEREQARVKSEWPYVLNSPTGRALLKERYKEKLIEMRPLLWIELVAWIIFGWGISSWRITFIGYIVSVPVLFALPVWGEYRRMKRERRDILLRRGIPDDQI